MATSLLSWTLYSEELYSVHFSSVKEVGEGMGRGRRRKPGERAGLDIDSILAEARGISSEDGLENLTMRRLAQRLSVAPNALYSHFRDKDALLDALLDSFVGEVEVPPLEGMGWRLGLTEIMRSTRRFLLAHTDLVPHLLAHPTRGPNAIRLGEEMLRLLARGGVEGQKAAEALQILLVYTFGFVAQEAPRRLDPNAALARELSKEAFRSSRNRPRMRALAEPLAEYPAGGTFEKGLAWLLDGLAADAPPGPSQHSVETGPDRR